MKTNILMATFLSGLVLVGGAASAQEEGDQRPERPGFAELDLNDDGSLTQEELQSRGQDRFADADTDGDGALSVAEMVAASQARAEERAAAMLARLDANEDGLLQQEEMQERGGDRMARMFERIDADGDGAVSEAEFEEMRERMKERRGGGEKRDRG